MAKTNEAEAHFYRCLRVAIAAFVRGSAPILSIEFARKHNGIRPAMRVRRRADRGGRGVPYDQNAMRPEGRNGPRNPTVKRKSERT